MTLAVGGPHFSDLLGVVLVLVGIIGGMLALFRGTLAQIKENQQVRMRELGAEKDELQSELAALRESVRQLKARPQWSDVVSMTEKMTKHFDRQAEERQQEVLEHLERQLAEHEQLDQARHEEEMALLRERTKP